MTIQDLLAMTPDAKTSEGARRLYFSRRWRLLGGDGKWLWGEFEVNGPKPLRATVDLLQGNFYCNCRSRQRPCTHALSLVIILNNQPERITVSSPTEWVLEYQETRLPKASSGDNPPQSPAPDHSLATSSDPKLQSRIQLMDQGIEELELRLLDIGKQGLADTSALGTEFWQDTATRLNDAKLGGLANRLRPLTKVSETPDFQLQTSIVGDLYLAVRSWRKREELPPERQSELLQLLGVNLKKEEVLQQPAKDDHWLVMGTVLGAEDRLRYRRVWLRGESRKRYALLLEYAFGEQPFERSWPLASSWAGKVHYYPGSYPQRAVFPQPTAGGRPYDGLNGYADYAAMIYDYRRALALQPWLITYPVYLMAVVPARVKGVAALLDPQDVPLPLPAEYSNFYSLLSASGGSPISLFAEFDGNSLRPLSLFTGSGFLAV